MTATIDLSLRARGGREERSFTMEGVEVRQAADGSRTFYGVATTFNEPYVVHDAYGTFEETISPRALDRTLANRGGKIHLYFGHGGIPLASSASGTLNITTDGKRANVVGQLATDSPYAQSVSSAVERGDANEMSVGFVVPEGGDVWSADYSQRTINEMKLMEVSIVPRGANANTEAVLRHLNIDPGDAGSIRSGISRLEKLLLRGPDPGYPTTDKATAKDADGDAPDAPPIANPRIKLLYAYAKALGLLDQLPADWNPSGTLVNNEGQTLAATVVEEMRKHWEKRIGGLPAAGYQSTDTPNLPTNDAAIAEPDWSTATAMLLALDGAIDNIELALNAGDVATAARLVAGADTTIDAILEALNIPDPDELADMGDKGATGE